MSTDDLPGRVRDCARMDRSHKKTMILAVSLVKRTTRGTWRRIEISFNETPIGDSSSRVLLPHQHSHIHRDWTPWPARPLRCCFVIVAMVVSSQPLPMRKEEAATNRHVVVADPDSDEVVKLCKKTRVSIVLVAAGMAVVVVVAAGVAVAVVVWCPWVHDSDYDVAGAG